MKYSDQTRQLLITGTQIRDSYAAILFCLLQGIVEFMSSGLQNCVQNVGSSLEGLKLNDSVWNVR